MIDKNFRKEFDQYCDDLQIEPIIFDNPSFDRSIIGLSDDDRLVYDYDKMILEMAEDDGITTEEATEFIEYNTIRALPYIPQDQRPIIIYSSTIDMLRE